MRILAVQHSVPERQVTNDDWRRYLREHLRDRFSEEEVRRADERLAQFLEMAGTQTRYGVRPGDKPLDFVLQAAREALAAAEVEPEAIDFVIYAGVNRGWLEPATATVIQSELGLVNATSFDIIEACASWLRALQVAHSLIRGGTYRRGLIVNCECGLERLDPVEIRGLDRLEEKLAQFTLGEAATATVVGPGEADDFYFRFRSWGEHFDLCMIPLHTIAGFLPGPADDKPPRTGFYSNSEKLIGTAIKLLLREFRQDARLTGTKYDTIFTHSASARASEFALRHLELPAEKHVDIHARFGNTNAASVPLAMSVAIQEGRLKRGDKALVLMASAGITIGFATFTF